MRLRRTLQLVSLLAGLGLASLGFIHRQTAAAQATPPQLAQQAMALLQAQCLQCHGADKGSGLDLRTRAGLLTGGSRGAAIVAGQAEQSLLYQFLIGKHQPRMPLGGTLQSAEIELVKRWIDAGAPWATAGAGVTAAPANSELAPLGLYKGRPISEEERNYWAFRPPVRPALPAVGNSDWVKNPIDAFVLSKLTANGLQPSPPADKRTLLRRVTFDLTGLPPSREELDAFLADASTEAYAKVVKRLLASPRYGERWAQHWLDVVRFGETNGYELDAERDQAWRYRDYVIKALNEDKPYDRFLLEQLAGDELDPQNFELQVATGFLRAGPQHVVAGNQDEALNRQEWLTEMMFSVGGTVMGLTVGCARCHDHKFDPIPQADYYRLQAFLAATDNHEYKQPTDAQKQAYDQAVKAHQAKLKPIKEQIAAIEKPYKEKLEAVNRAKLEPLYAQALAKDARQRTEEETRLAKEARSMIQVKWDEVLAALAPADRETRAGLRRQMHALDLYAPEPLPAALAVSDKLSPVPEMHVLKGGDVHRLGAAVQPRFPSVLLPAAAPPLQWITPVRSADGRQISTGRRLTLARWLTQKDHPLTARVMMNRLWQHHFGRGIVATPNDFGRNGQPPTHPELLDWLALEFTSRGWSLKQMHELLLLSSTYQQSAAVDTLKQQRDPENKLLWRMNRQRLDAEAMRDAVLAAAGTLTEQLYGPSVRVPIEPEVYDTIFTEYEADNLWPVHPDARQHTRRSLYLLRKRNVRLPLLVAFDSPDLMSSCGARSVSVHALQALTLMNSPMLLQQSKALAERLLRAEQGPVPRIKLLYQLTLGRWPTAAEQQLTREFLRQQTALLAAQQQRGEKITQLASLPNAVSAPAAAAWVDLCLATLNLNEFIYVN
jgi:mono/diheme cytochrome c family protein